MGSLFSNDAPFVPPTPVDTTAANLRQQEQDRAEQTRTVATQEQLGQETLIRSRRYGTRSLLGSFGSGQSLLGSG